MDTTRHLLKYFFKVALFFFALAVVWAVFALVAPAGSFRAIMGNGTSTPSEDWLPSPRAYSGLLSGRNANVARPKEYVHGAAFDGYNLNNSQYAYSQPVSYVNYNGTSSSITNLDGAVPSKDVVVKKPIQASSSPVQSIADANPKVFIRNLSIYEGGHVYTGLTFVGEARSTMFREGKFPIIMVDAAGRFIGLSAAVATSDWTVAGWTRFETKITYALPSKVSCSMIFEEALLSAERTRLPLRVPLSMKCN